jgi:invasion protein IalB
MISGRALQFRPHLVLLCAALSLLLTSSSAGAQPAAPSAGNKSQSDGTALEQRNAVREIKYGDWQKFCFKTPGSNQVCRTTISGKFDTGQSAVRADLIERDGGKARLQIFLPVGVYLQAGVRLTVDEGKPRRIPYVWCLTNTCIAANVADAALIREMESGKKLQLEVVDSSVLRVSTTLPLGQFASVRQGSPARTFEQDIDEE